MKQKDMMVLIFVGIIAAVLAFVVSNQIFKTGHKNLSAPSVEAINPSLPDVRNQSDYKLIFNSQALDPTQPIQIQGNNSQPFTGH